jgi:hypothetical protein
MSQAAFDSYIGAMYQAKINPEKTASGGHRVVQTIGSAPASAGTHGKDGTDPISGGAYCCAVDISVKHDLKQAQIETMLKALWHHGFAAWWRHTGSFSTNEHVHAVYSGLPMKLSLRNQIHDFLAARSGLVGHADDAFIKANLTEADEQHIRTLFLACNPAVD